MNFWQKPAVNLVKRVWLPNASSEDNELMYALMNDGITNTQNE